MPHNTDRPFVRRHSLRLEGYDYALPGAYFITVCTKNRLPQFGKIVDGQMHLSAFGEIARTCWTVIPTHFPHTGLATFVVMPDHVHGIVIISERSRAEQSEVGGTARHGLPLPEQGKHRSCCRPQPLYTVGQKQGSLGSIVGSYKAAVSRQINSQRGTPGKALWQHNYYEHVIRDEAEMIRASEYIRQNPSRWEASRETDGDDRDLW